MDVLEVQVLSRVNETVHDIRFLVAYLRFLIQSGDPGKWFLGWVGFDSPERLCEV